MAATTIEWSSFLYSTNRLCFSSERRHYYIWDKGNTQASVELQLIMSGLRNIHVTKYHSTMVKIPWYFGAVYLPWYFYQGTTMVYCPSKYIPWYIYRGKPSTFYKTFSVLTKSMLTRSSAVAEYNHFVSLNISLSHSRSLKVIRNDTVE